MKGVCLLDYERRFWSQGVASLAGIDEAGRGPLAGPVYAAAVVLAPGFAEAQFHGLLAGLTDSKKLTASLRDSFYSILQAAEPVRIGVGIASVEEIDQINILRATHLAMRRAVENLPALPDHALVDGRPVPGLPCPSTSIVGGDGKSLSIAAASVIAKVARDQYMCELDAQYPQYGFARHKGYGTSVHLQSLLEFGPSPAHRRTFRPVMEAIEIRRRLQAEPPP